MEHLTEQKILQIMREEYEAKVQRLDDELKAFMDVEDEGEKKGIIGVDTKVRHKETQLLYTVDGVGPRDISLRTPEGKVFNVSSEEFEQHYELD